MPTIDERKITLTETGRQVVKHDVNSVAQQLTLAAQHSIQTRCTISSGGSAFNGELARHEVRIKKGTSVKATFLWDARSIWGGAAPDTWALDQDTHTASPPHAGDVEFLMPTDALVWSAAFTLDSEWTHIVTAGRITLDTDYNATVTGSLVSNGVKFTFKLFQNGVVLPKFTGDVVITHSSRLVSAVKGTLLPGPDSSTSRSSTSGRKPRAKKT